MARLADHPYIVSVITAGVTLDGGRPYLVMRYCPPPDLGMRVRSNPMAVVDAVSTGIKLASAIETAHRVRHPAPRHQAQQRPGHDLPRAGADRLRHRRPHRRRRRRERRPHLLPLVAARAARRPLQRLRHLRRLLAGRDDLAPARRPLAVLDPGRRQLDPGPQSPASCTPLPRPPSAPTYRRPSTGCSSSAWPRTPRTVRRARSSWRAACSRSRPTANWSRTAVAVEGDRPDSAVGAAEARARGGPHRDEGGHGDLRLRSAPHRHGPGRAGGPEHEERRSPALVWAVLGVVAAAALIGGLCS